MTSNNKLVKEAATVVVLNGGETVGLAKQEGDTLAGKGLTVLSVGDAPEPATDTVIIDNTAGKKPASKQLLKKQFGDKSSTNVALAQQYNADFVVILGSSFKPRADSQ